MSGENWFSFSEDGGFQRHASAEDARAEAQRALDYDAEQAGWDGWPEGTDRICWGMVAAAAVKTDTHKHGPDCRPDSDDDGDDDTCTEGYSMLFDHICEFSMTPTVPPSEIDALRARAEAAEARAAQAEADARLLLGLAAIEFTTRMRFLVAPGLDEPEMAAMYAEADRAEAVPVTDVSAAVRRILATAGATAGGAR